MRAEGFPSAETVESKRALGSSNSLAMASSNHIWNCSMGKRLTSETSKLPFV